MTWEIIIGALKIIGALGFFLFGMKTMSEGLQRVAGNKLRSVLGAMTTNRFTGVLTGFTITAILQSSSATTVMTVSFVNAGLITLTESAGVMMGANIGTTITGWLVSIIGFKLKIANIALPIIAIGLPFIFSSSSKSKKWGESIIGFALLFLGLAALKDAVPDLRENEAVFSFLQQFSNPGILSRLMFVIAGTLITIIMQSSSAAMTLTLALVAKGLPLDIAAAMVLGENIGTTITAELASLVGNSSAKRSARIHSIFNLVGVTWMIFLAPVFLHLISIVFPAQSATAGNTFALAAFHTAFNTLNVMLLIGFVPLLVKLATRSIKSKGGEEDEYKLHYLNQGVVGTTSISIEEAKKEVEMFGITVQKMSQYLIEQSNSVKEKKLVKLNKKIKKNEDFTDDLEEQISQFLLKVSQSRLSEEDSKEVQGLMSTITDLERIADIILRMSNDLMRKFNLGVEFNDDQRDKLNRLSNLVEEAIVIMINNLAEQKPDMKTVLDKENEINSFVKSLRKNQYSSIDSPEYDIKAGIVYRDIYNSYEKLGDHIVNVSEAIPSE